VVASCRNCDEPLVPIQCGELKQKFIACVIKVMKMVAIVMLSYNSTLNNITCLVTRFDRKFNMWLRSHMYVYVHIY